MTIAILDERKQVGRDTMEGMLTAISAAEGLLQTDTALENFANLRLSLGNEAGSGTRDALYAKVVETIDRARATRAIVVQNIAFALGVKGVFLALGAFGIATMWEAVIADMGVAVVAVLNAARAVR